LVLVLRSDQLEVVVLHQRKHTRSLVQTGGRGEIGDGMLLAAGSRVYGESESLLRRKAENDEAHTKELKQGAREGGKNRRTMFGGGRNKQDDSTRVDRKEKRLRELARSPSQPSDDNHGQTRNMQLEKRRDGVADASGEGKQSEKQKRNHAPMRISTFWVQIKKVCVPGAKMRKDMSSCVNRE